MKRTQKVTTLVVSLGLLGASLGVAQAEETPPHGHLLVTGIEFDDTGEPIGYKHCRLLAAGRPVPLHAHHDRLHIGTAGEMLWTRANAAVVPLAPLAPWSTCEEFAEMIFAE
ncbi:hypothetical protein [Nitriliruptor alkaliphilus]|uniref:hypothetical protein n=1 Tax=Nitriliruptor alkaliphilus TaxID=427918 RepID=UPI00069634AC|nr:hypothetical protein [Nitriliruptor alkaliphilus]